MLWGRLPPHVFVLEAEPGGAGALGADVELVVAGLDGEEEGVVEGEFVEAAIVVAVAGDGLFQQAGFEGGELEEPFIENDVGH